MRKFLCCLLTAVLGIAANAQIAMQSEELNTNTDPWLGGRAGLTVLSTHNDLVIVSVPNDPLDQFAKPVAEGKYFRYDVTMDVPEGSRSVKRVFKVSRTGKTLSTNLAANFEPNKRISYHVSEVEKPITIQPNPNSGLLGSTDGNKACVEIIMPSEVNLQVACSDKLQYEKDYKTQQDGTIRNALLIDLPSLAQQTEEYYKVKAELDALNQKDYNAMTDAEFDRVDELEKAIQPLETAFQELTTITVRGEKTNAVSIRLAGQEGIVLAPKQLLSYIVMVISSNSGSEYSAALERAETEEQRLKFGAAKTHYEFALALPADKKPLNADDDFLRPKIQLMDECRDLYNRGMGAYMKAKKESEAGTLSESGYLELVGNAAQCFAVLFEKCQAEKAMAYYNSFSKKLENSPWIISGKVTYSDGKQGMFVPTPLEGCEIYFIDGVSREKKLVGESGPGGAYRVQLHKGNSGLLQFEWNDRRKKKEKLKARVLNLNSIKKEHYIWDVQFGR